MSGYKRVNFYELCRLCATNQQKEKTHIFQEEGRRKQLQDKIKSLLDLQVREDDCLPKVVCSECLRNLENSYTFRNGCIASESMLSTYFKNFQFTEDFTKSGQVYIKDETPDHRKHVPHEPEIITTIKEEELNNQLSKFAAQTQYVTPKLDTNEMVTLIDLEGIFNGKLQKKKDLNLDEIFDPKKKAYSKYENMIIPQLGGTTNSNNTTAINTNPQPPVQNIIKVPENFANNYFQTTYGKAPAQTQTWENAGGEGNSAPNNQVPVGVINTSAPDKPAKVHQCNMCKKVFKRREHLYQHMKLHTGFRPFTCENCNKAFMRKEHLLRHMTSHSGLKSFQCDICEKAFSRNDNLLKHKKTHNKESNFSCEICGKVFVMRHYYLAHKVTHETERNQNALGCAVKMEWNVLKV